VSVTLSEKRALDLRALVNPFSSNLDKMGRVGLSDRLNPLSLCHSGEYAHQVAIMTSPPTIPLVRMAETRHLVSRASEDFCLFA
jgi:hypothetical protein